MKSNCKKLGCILLNYDDFVTVLLVTFMYVYTLYIKTMLNDIVAIQAAGYSANGPKE